MIRIEEPAHNLPSPVAAPVVIRLARPEQRNALTPEMHEEMCRLWANFRDDDRADVAILTGVGDAFCAGADLATYVPKNYVDAPPSRVREALTAGRRRPGSRC